mgnify:CR=1 FL=1
MASSPSRALRSSPPRSSACLPICRPALQGLRPRASGATSPRGNACTAFVRRSISRLVLSCTLSVRRRFQCDAGKSRQARASGSASSQIPAAFGQHSSSISAARWQRTRTCPASFALKTGFMIPAALFLRLLEPAAPMQLLMRWTAHLCHAAPRKTRYPRRIYPAHASSRRNRILWP